MSFLHLKRIHEKAAMALPEEVDAYASMTSHPYLEALDQSLLDQAVQLGITDGLVLDIGTGPGQIPLGLCRRCPAVKCAGIDLSDYMLMTAASRSFEVGLQDRVSFQRGDGTDIPYDDHSFEHVMCNSVLHHCDDPVPLLNEIARVVKPGGGIIVRDLVRPGRLMYPVHVLIYGRYYTGLFRRLYKESVRAAFTTEELKEILVRSRLQGASVFRRGRSHAGIARAAHPECAEY